MRNYEELRQYHERIGKTFSDEFYDEMLEWNGVRKKLVEDISLKKTSVTPNKVNAYGQKRKTNGRWNYDYIK